MDQKQPDAKQIEDVLNANCHIKDARRATKEKHALEYYSRGWDDLDATHGVGNPFTTKSVAEYMKTPYPEADDAYDYRRIQMMRNSFVLRRTGFSQEERLALLALDLYHRKHP